MPAKINPRDWDRLFRSGAPRRGGPLRALSNVLIIVIVLGLLGAGAYFALQFGVQQRQVAATAQAMQAATSNAATFATRTARALNATVAAATAAAPTITPVAAPLGVGNVRAAGNLRSETRIAPETVIGQICVGDEVAFLEQQTIDAAIWYRIRVTRLAPDCDPQRVQAGTEGWASNTLLSEPTR